MARGRRKYRPAEPFNVAMRLLIPTVTTVKGVPKKTWPDPEESPLFYGSFRTFGGTESTVNDLFTVVDTGTIDTWYRPDFSADCRIYLSETGEIFELMASPEDINRQHQYTQLRVRKIGGTS